MFGKETWLLLTHCEEGEITAAFWLVLERSFFNYFVALPEYSTLGKQNLFYPISRGLKRVPEKGTGLSTALQS